MAEASKASEITDKLHPLIETRKHSSAWVVSGKK
jgi:hypothetical protein